MSDRIYALKYTFQPGQFRKEDAKGEWDGLTDKCLFVSVLCESPKPHQGPVSYAVVSCDGFRNKAMVPTEQFSAFVSIAASMTENKLLPDWQRQIAEHVMQATRAMMAARRKWGL